MRYWQCYFLYTFKIYFFCVLKKYIIYALDPFHVRNNDIRSHLMHSFSSLRSSFNRSILLSLKWADLPAFQDQPLAFMLLLFPGSACKFPCLSSLFYCQLTVSSPPLLFLLISLSWLHKSSSKICGNTFLLKAVTPMLAWQSLFGALKFPIVETFCSCCLNRVRVRGRLPPFLQQQKKDVVIDIYIYFFLLPWCPIQSWGKIVLCSGEAFEMAGKTSESASSGDSLWLCFHSTHPLNPSLQNHA